MDGNRLIDINNKWNIRLFYKRCYRQFIVFYDNISNDNDSKFNDEEY